MPVKTKQTRNPKEIIQQKSENSHHTPPILSLFPLFLPSGSHPKQFDMNSSLLSAIDM